MKVRDETTVDGDFVDLSSMMLEDEAPEKDSRMTIADEEPTGDEEQDFHDMLARFKQGIDENIDETDFQSHYDLGVAFKEMGLLDEAIAELQKALRAPDGKLRTSEMLGCVSSRRRRMAWRSRSCGAGSSCPPRATRSASASCTGSAAPSRSREEGRRARLVRACVCGGHSVPRRGAPHQSAGEGSMTLTLPRVALSDVQLPVAAELEQVVDELRRIIAADFPIISEVNEHLLRMKGKLFRPTLLLLSHRAAGGSDARAVTLAAVVELIHLATLVHDDSVDHSVLRRGLPTINALFSHQIAVIMGDYLYSRAIIELVQLDDSTALRVLARVTNEMTVGRCGSSKRTTSWRMARRRTIS